MGQDRASAAHDACDALADQGNIFTQNPGVDRHVVNALIRLLFDDFEHQLRREVLDMLHPRYGFIDRHGANRHSTVTKIRFTDLVDVAASREVHHRVGAIFHRGAELFQLFFQIGGCRRVADIGVDLAF